jgi:hypothetical protein
MSAFTKFYGDVTWANSASAKAITCTARRIHREICELSIRPGSAHHSRQNRCSKQNSLPRRDRVEDARACHSAEHLRDDVRQQVRSREPFARHQPTDTAGFKWHPEICPMANAMVSTVRPKARRPRRTQSLGQETSRPARRCRIPRTPPRTFRETPLPPAFRYSTSAS